MFPQVASALGKYSDSRVITIDENIPDNSSFLLHHLISAWLKNKENNKVLIIGLEQSFGHYHGVSLKMGNNLLKLRQSGRVVFYEGLKDLAELLESDLEEVSVVKTLYQRISGLMKEDTLVVVDQVFMLSCLGLSTRSVYLLCHYLVLASLQLERSQTVLRLYQSDCEEVVGLIRRLGQLHLSVTGLYTGQSRDVSGVLSLLAPPAPAQTFHFKIMDKDVKMFAPGTSSAVL